MLPRLCRWPLHRRGLTLVHSTRFFRAWWATWHKFSIEQSTHAVILAGRACAPGVPCPPLAHGAARLRQVRTVAERAAAHAHSGVSYPTLGVPRDMHGYCA